MKFHVVVFVDTEHSSSVITKGYYESMSEAESNLRNISLDYVRLDGGERQEKIAFQDDKTLDEIKNDVSLNTGLYLKTEEIDDKKTVVVYEKCIKDTGYVFSSIEPYIKKRGIFTITEIDFNVPERFSCGCNIRKNRTTISLKKSQSSPSWSYVDELSDVIKNGGFKLKPAKPVNKILSSPSPLIAEINRLSANGFNLKPINNP